MPPAPDALDAAVSRIAAANRPLFVLGAGARFDAAEVVALAEQLGAPVATTFKAKGLISDSHPLGCGVLGRSGTPIASWFMNESDLIVAFGASFSNHTGIAPTSPLCRWTTTHGTGPVPSVDVPVLGHVGVTARALAERLAGGASCLDHREEVLSGGPFGGGRRRLGWSTIRAEGSTQQRCSTRLAGCVRPTR